MFNLLSEVLRALPRHKRLLSIGCELVGQKEVIIVDVRICKELSPTIHLRKYTQTKKLRPIFMVLYLSIQLRRRNKNIPKCLSNVGHTKIGNYLILSSYHEGLLNLMCTQLFPFSSGS